MLSCILVGSTSLVTRCGRFLHSRGHRIISVYTDDKAVRDSLPDMNGIDFYPLEDVLSVPARRPCDILFSIANEKILPQEVLSFPAQMSINYHDSLLPSYAGRNASAWSIYHRQKRHGITWHVMEERVDSGDILIQERLEVSEEDTAFTLNTRCFDAAFHGFEILVAQLETGALQRKPMDLSRRTYFSGSKRLPNCGIVDWNQSAEQITAAVRAADFGLYPSDIGLVKTCVGGRWLVIKKAVSENRAMQSNPGAVLEHEKDRLVIAAGKGQVVLLEIEDLTGNKLSIGEPDTLGSNEADHFSQPALQEASRLFEGSVKNDKFWAGCFRGRCYPELNDLGIRAASNLNPGAWENLEFRISPEWAEYLGLPLQITFALLWMILLWRITGSETITVNVQWPFPEKLDMKLRGLIMPELPLTLRFDQDCTLNEAKERLVKTWKTLGGRQPVFYDQYPNDRKKTTAPVFGWLLDAGALDKENPECLGFIPCERKHFWRLNYHTSVTQKENVLVLKDLFYRLTRQAFKYPEKRLCALNLLNARDEKMQCMKRKPFLSPAPFVSVFSKYLETLRRFPDRIAVHCGQKATTYQELGLYVNNLTEKIFNQGIGKGDVVVILMERDVHFIASLLAVLGTGAAYLPLDVKQPRRRIKEIITDSKSALVLTDQGKNSLPEAVDIPVLSLGGELFAENSPNAIRTVAINENDPAYVIYTSGSTGSPKGTVVSHGSLARFMRENIKQYRISSNDRILQLCSLSFDASVEEIFSAILTGAALYLRTNEMLYSFDHFLQKCREWKLTVIGLFPAHFQDILEVMEKTGRFPEEIRLVTTGGEALQKPDIQRWQSFFRMRKIKPPRLINVYGLTETTIASLVCDLTNKEIKTPAIPIGRPLKGTLVHILDRYGNPVPAGVPGEIHIGGGGVAIGYLNLEDVTKKTFLHDPFHQGARMFKTGDFGKFNPDGEVGFLGRKDRQIKSSGYRIELEEIRHRLRQLPGIKKAAVIHHKTGHSGQNKIVAFLVPEAYPDARDMVIADEGWAKENTKRLSDYLPAYMIPSMYCFLKEMPLDQSGKIDANRLHSFLGQTKKAEANANADPDEVIRRLWDEILPCCQGDRHDHFFNSGGDSLAAVEFIARLEESTGITLSLEDIFFHPQIEKLIQVAKGKTRKAATMNIVSSCLPQEIITRFRVVNEECPLPLASDTSLLVIGNAEGPQPPLFWCFNSMKSEPSALAGALGGDQPLYGIFSGGVLFPGGELDKQLAGHWAEEIMAIKPKGPYRLGGNCRGAGVALETACLLMERGEKIEGLCLLEYFNPVLYQVSFRVRLLYGSESELKAYEPFGWKKTGWKKAFKVAPEVHWTQGAHGEFFLPRNCGMLASKINRFFNMQPQR